MMDWRMNVIIQRMKNDIVALNGQVARFSYIEKDLKNIIRKTLYYKEQKSQRPALGAKIASFFTQIPPELILNSLSFRADKADVVATASSPLNFSVFIANLFKSGAATEIVLHSAYLDTNTHNFTVEMEVIVR